MDGELRDNILHISQYGISIYPGIFKELRKIQDEFHNGKEEINEIAGWRDDIKSCFT